MSLCNNSKIPLLAVILLLVLGCIDANIFSLNLPSPTAGRQTFCRLFALTLSFNLWRFRVRPDPGNILATEEFNQKNQ